MSKFVIGHIYLWEKGTKNGQPCAWNDIPDNLLAAQWKAVDVLYITPFVVDKDTHRFRLAGYEGDQMALVHRFQYVVKTARQQNPGIKLIAMQWWGGGDNLTLLQGPNVHSNIQTYAQSVLEFLQNSASKVWTEGSQKISGHFDGWDVDYEHPTDIAETPIILAELRKKLSTKFLISVTTATTNNLNSEDVAKSLDYLVMQNYSGGRGRDAEYYKEQIKGLQDKQIVYGISSEEPVKNDVQDWKSLQTAIQTAKDKYAGVMLWRLNSDVYKFENMMQVMVHNMLHSGSVPVDEKLVQEGWSTNGFRD